MLFLMNSFEKIKITIFTRVISKIIVRLFGEDFYSTRCDYDPAEKRKVKKLILAIPSFGCAHYFKRGGCAMCAFNKEIEDYRFRWMHPRMIFLLINALLSYLQVKIDKKEIKAEVLIVFMAGSFINEEELSVRAQEAVINFFLTSGFKKLAIESRSEYVLKNKQRIQEIMRKIHPLKLEVYLGLESANDKIRNQYVKKGLSKKEYERSVLFLKNLGVVVNTYILLGSPYLDRKEVIKESCKSAYYAWEAGSNVVSLETYCVQADTPWAKLYQEKKLRLLSLWDIITVLKKIDKVSPSWYLGKFADWPLPIAVPGSCEKCENNLTIMLKLLREDHDVTQFDSLLVCSCAT